MSVEEKARDWEVLLPQILGSMWYLVAAPKEHTKEDIISNCEGYLRRVEQCIGKEELTRLLKNDGIHLEGG